MVKAIKINLIILLILLIVIGILKLRNKEYKKVNYMVIGYAMCNIISYLIVRPFLG